MILILFFNILVTKQQWQTPHLQIGSMRQENKQPELLPFPSPPIIPVLFDPERRCSAAHTARFSVLPPKAASSFQKQAKTN